MVFRETSDFYFDGGGGDGERVYAQFNQVVGC